MPGIAGLSNASEEVALFQENGNGIIINVAASLARYRGLN